MVDQHASAASEAAVTSEPLSLAAQQMYQSLADADVTASTGYLYGRTPPFAYRQRYQRGHRGGHRGPEGGDRRQPAARPSEPA